MSDEYILSLTALACGGMFAGFLMASIVYEDVRKILWGILFGFFTLAVGVGCAFSTWVLQTQPMDSFSKFSWACCLLQGLATLLFCLLVIAAFFVGSRDPHLSNTPEKGDVV